MKRFAGESFEQYKERRAETQAIEQAHLQGRYWNGQYVDRTLDGILREDVNLARAHRMAWAILFLILSGGVGLLIGTVIYELIMGV